MARPRKTTVDNTALLEAALEGLELQKSRVEEQIAEVRRMLGGKASKPVKGSPVTAVAPAAATKKRELSPAARKRIAAAQKKRWAAYRKTAPKAEKAS